MITFSLPRKCLTSQRSVFWIEAGAFFLSEASVIGILGGDGVDPGAFSQKLLCVVAAIVGAVAVLATCEAVELAATLLTRGSAAKGAAVSWMAWHIVAAFLLMLCFVRVAGPAWAIGSGLYFS